MNRIPVILNEYKIGIIPDFLVSGFQKIALLHPGFQQFHCFRRQLYETVGFLRFGCRFIHAILSVVQQVIANLNLVITENSSPCPVPAVQTKHPPDFLQQSR